MSYKFSHTISSDELTLTIFGLRQSVPFVFSIPKKAKKSKILKLIFWYLLESNSFNALCKSNMSTKCKRLEIFFDFLNSSDSRRSNYAEALVKFDGELSDDVFSVFDNYLIHHKRSLTYRSAFKQIIKTIITAYSNENPDYRHTKLYNPLIETVLGVKIQTPERTPKPSAGEIIDMIATHEQKKSFESGWFKSFLIHFSLILNKIREEVKKIEYVQGLLNELEKYQTLDQCLEYMDFINGKHLGKQSNENIQKSFKFYESILKNGNEFIVDCVFHSLNPKIFDDHDDWKNMPIEAPLKRFKPKKMSDDEWLEYKRNSLDVFKRKRKGIKHIGEYTVCLMHGGRKGKQITFSTPIPFILKNLIKPTTTEYMFLRFLLGWHQFTEVEQQNNLTLEDVQPFDDDVIRVLDAYKKRTGNSDENRNIPMQEFVKTSDEYKIFKIYREMLNESYEKYSMLFPSKAVNERLLFSDNHLAKGTKYYASESFSNLFKYVDQFSSGKTGEEAKLFYELFSNWMKILLIKKGFSGKSDSAKQKSLEKIKHHMNEEWKSLSVDQFGKLTLSFLNANSFRLASQGYVKAYSIKASKVGIKQDLKNNSADEITGAFHAHSGDMDHKYMIRNRNPFLAESENVFGKQVASEMVQQAKTAWTCVLTPLEDELQNQLRNTDVWSLEDLREHLGISTLEEIHSYRNDSEKARNLLFELLEKDNISALEGYGHQVIGAFNHSSQRQVIIDSPLTCFLMMHQINYLDEQIEGFLNKKITPIKKSLDSVTVKALITRAYFAEIVETRFSVTTIKGAEQLLRDYSNFPPIQL